MLIIDIDVKGMPAPQGSKRFVGTNKAGKGIMVESSAKVKPWRVDVKWAAERAMEGKPLELGAIYMDILFYFPRPKSASIKKRPHHTVTPDLSKLIRSTEDAMTGIVYKDDAQITTMFVGKTYSLDGSSGARIKLYSQTVGQHLTKEF